VKEESEKKRANASDSCITGEEVDLPKKILKRKSATKETKRGHHIRIRYRDRWGKNNVSITAPYWLKWKRTEEKLGTERERLGKKRPYP